MELTLFHREFISFCASDIAAASLVLARHMLGKPRRVRFFFPLFFPQTFTNFSLLLTDSRRIRNCSPTRSHARRVPRGTPRRCLAHCHHQG
jgi:hypothetical protein